MPPLTWSLLKTLKNTETCQPAITNCAFMPTDADAANIHVPVWMVSAEAQRSNDRDSATEWATFP